MIGSNKKFKSLSKLIGKKRHTWLVTGVAGFIGSNLLETLLTYNQKVIGIDNFSTGKKKNLNFIKKILNNNQWKNFKFFKADLNHFNFLKLKNLKIDYVLHQAARGSVIRSIIDPVQTNNDNIGAFLKVINASRALKAKNFVYASSSSVYGDSKTLPKQEFHNGNLLSNYALTKYTNEKYSEVFFRQYKFKSIGLRYFNVFGKFQDPNGSYAAVIPRWINNTINKKDIFIFGDGKTSRDFSPVMNVVYANLLAALSKMKSYNYIFNVGNEERTTLNYLAKLILKNVKTKKKNLK